MGEEEVLAKYIQVKMVADQKEEERKRDVGKGDDDGGSASKKQDEPKFAANEEERKERDDLATVGSGVQKARRVCSQRVGMWISSGGKAMFIPVQFPHVFSPMLSCCKPPT